MYYTPTQGRGFDSHSFFPTLKKILPVEVQLRTRALVPMSHTVCQVNGIWTIRLKIPSEHTECHQILLSLIKICTLWLTCRVKMLFTVIYGTTTQLVVTLIAPKLVISLKSLLHQWTRTSHMYTCEFENCSYNPKQRQTTKLFTINNCSNNFNYLLVSIGL